MENKRTIKICSRDWDFILDSKRSGGEFNTYNENDNGKGYIVLGTKFKDDNFKFRLLLHEIMEAILVVDTKRFTNRMSSIEKENHLFVFDHEYMDTENLCAKITDALLSCNAIKINKIK